MKDEGQGHDTLAGRRREMELRRGAMEPGLQAATTIRRIVVAVDLNFCSKQLSCVVARNLRSLRAVHHLPGASGCDGPGSGIPNL